VGLLEPGRGPRRSAHGCRELNLAPLAAAFAAAALLAAPEIPAPGEVAENVVCREAPGQSYALYLPSSYSRERRWPILYLLDARGRATRPVERFRAAAEKYGWILASSRQSRSDTKDDPNTPALRAMWADTHARLSIDDARVYLAGFSGTARAVVALALQAPAAVAGVIGCGAGWPEELEPAAPRPFPYFGTAGDRDFNYVEMRALETALASTRSPQRIAYFSGGHDWPPPTVAADAAGWMELQAMKSGGRARDDALVAELYAAGLARANALLAKGAAAEAWLAYAHLADDFRTLADVAAAAEKARALGGTAEVRKALAEAADRDDREREAVRSMARRLHAALSAPDPPLPAALAAELGVADLKRRAASGSSADRAAAERILASLRVQVTFYLPEELAARGDRVRARLCLALAAEIDPGDPGPDHALAGVEARAGDVRRATKALDRAVDKGFRSFDALDADPDFAAIRADPKFREWLAAARARYPAVSPSPP
jgi:predicted esterase